VYSSTANPNIQVSPAKLYFITSHSSYVSPVDSSRSEKRRSFFIHCRNF